MPDQAKAAYETKPKPILQPQCPSCGRPENIVWVHGHGQCAHCHMNVMPCCDGETCEALQADLAPQAGFGQTHPRETGLGTK